MTDRIVLVPFLMWSDLITADGGPCLARTRSGEWCKHPIFRSMPHVEHDAASELVLMRAVDWERWMDSLCPTHRRGRWLEAAHDRRALFGVKR